MRECEGYDCAIMHLLPGTYETDVKQDLKGRRCKNEDGDMHKF